jgi:phage-related protein
LASAAPQLVAAGVQALASFIAGIVGHMPQLVTSVVNLVVAFVKAVASQLGKIATAGADLMLKFLTAIASFEAKVIAAGAHAILSFFSGIASMVPKVIEKGTEIVSNLLTGVSKALVRLVNKGADAVINFLNGIAEAIRTKGPELRAAGYNVADAIIDGMIDGIAELGQKIVNKFGDLIGSLPKGAKKLLGIHSPSTVFHEIGYNTMAGLAGGIDSGGSLVSKSIGNTADEIVDKTKATLSKVPEFLYASIDTNPTITPVLDLTQIEKQSKNIPDMIGSGSVLNLQPDTGKESAKQGDQLLQFMTASSDAWGVSAEEINKRFVPQVQFVQHNTSPKALTPAEIYRLTHNQLASAKGRLFGKADNIR